MRASSDGAVDDTPRSCFMVARTMKLSPGALLITVCAAALGGCASTPRTTASATSMATSVNAWRQLLTRMTGLEVKLIMGEPQKVRERANGQIWIYERTIGTRVDPVSARIVHEIWIDPIDNQIKLIPVPMQSLQRTDFIEVVEIHLVAGELTHVERTVVDRRSFSD
jgi:hypothetical protein